MMLRGPHIPVVYLGMSFPLFPLVSLPLICAHLYNVHVRTVCSLHGSQSALCGKECVSQVWGVCVRVRVWSTLADCQRRGVVESGIQ